MPERKLLAEFDFKFQTGVDKAQIMELARLDFVGRNRASFSPEVQEPAKVTSPGLMVWIKIREDFLLYIP